MKSAVVCLHRRFRSTYCDAIGLNMTVLLLSYYAVPPILKQWKYIFICFILLGSMDIGVFFVKSFKIIIQEIKTKN